MSTNGHINGGVEDPTCQWRMGFLTPQNKYLTAETFGFKVNASGTAMRKKQVWILEHDMNEDCVYLKSYLNRFIAAEKTGSVRCDSESKDPDTKFHLEYDSEGSGRWAFKSVKYGYYLSGGDDALNCSSRNQEWWMPHLATHPQLQLRNVNRRRYAFFNSEADEIQVTKIIPWGAESLITFEFKNGMYAVKTCDDRYLHLSGSLVEKPSKETWYTIEVRPGQAAGLALKDCEGKYLTAVGSVATLKSRNKTISKDELFTVEDNFPQVSLISHKKKRVSIKQGVDVTANQDEVSDKETFQMEFDKDTGKWKFQTVDHKYWTLAEASGLQAITSNPNKNTMFDIEWLDSGLCALKAANGNYITSKMSGHLFASSPAVTEKDMFAVELINRPILVLKSDYGYVGYKAGSDVKMECNRSVHDILHLEYLGDGKYSIKGAKGKYLRVGDDNALIADGDEATPFSLVFVTHTKFALKAPNGAYIKSEQNGIFSATGTEIKANTLWEY